MKKIPEDLLIMLDFDKSRDKSSYEERVGLPDELSAVMGRITMNFQYLEDCIDHIITEIFLGLDSEIGIIITAELSFKNKVNLFASLYYKLSSKRKFNLTEDLELEHFKYLVKALFKCEELRNQILHSNISMNWKTNQIERIKKTSKAKSGLKIIKETLNIPYLFDVSDFMNQIVVELEQSFN
ncbi:hypothetical protein FHR24_003145 [Wenyingzhuangia heitensis]|uniref:RiboL-PSP-HEPN domain-containing protein n=1 Tax=Wenyingzhuangia heitensis TaxID=1487859 RepID=A0ABX0UCT4_9FLAO|nr:hypothetical protein [Wenyingzhuangia heitensis]NIJ46650.1 hypothetical protein [Wenyingzhuangia heitensis]